MCVYPGNCCSFSIVTVNASIRRNIGYGTDREVSDAEIYQVAKAAALGDFLSRQADGLDTIVGERGVRLSGGERARVGLARCLLKQPSIILLDEGMDYACLLRLVSSRQKVQFAHQVSRLTLFLPLFRIVRCVFRARHPV